MEAAAGEAAAVKAVEAAAVEAAAAVNPQLSAKATKPAMNPGRSRNRKLLDGHAENHETDDEDETVVDVKHGDKRSEVGILRLGTMAQSPMSSLPICLYKFQLSRCG